VELLKALRRTADVIFDRGGFIRKIENLGPRTLPYKVSIHGLVNREGHAFVYKFDIPPPFLADINEEFARDVDIVKRFVFRQESKMKFDCTLEDELQPPAYRKDVIEMMRIAKKSQKEKYSLNTGLDYYPFQK
jgi:small subunit ribosomal protein S6